MGSRSLLPSQGNEWGKKEEKWGERGGNLREGP